MAPDASGNVQPSHDLKSIIRDEASTRSSAFFPFQVLLVDTYTGLLFDAGHVCRELLLPQNATPGLGERLALLGRDIRRIHDARNSDERIAALRALHPCVRR